MSDLKCPYCQHEYDYNSCFEDLDESNEMRACCPVCEKEYRVYVDFYPSFSEGQKVDCWNGISCEYKTCKYNERIEGCIHCGGRRLRKV